MADRPAYIQLRLLENRMVHPTVGWVQGVINRSEYVEPKLVIDDVFGNHTAQESEELQYRLGYPDYKAAWSLEDLEILYNWTEGNGLPADFGPRSRRRRNEADKTTFKGWLKGWGITARSWMGLTQPASALMRPLTTPVSGGSWAYPDPEGSRGPDGVKRHYGIDWFSADGAGAPLVSPVAGRVARVTHSATNSGQVFGGTVMIRANDDGSPWANYRFVFRHISPLQATVYHLPVKPGTLIANVTKWTGGSDHTHHEIYLPGPDNFPYIGPPTAINPYEFYKKHGAI